MEYNNIKENIINNFLKPRYQFSCVYDKKFVINHISKNSWFPTSYNEIDDVLIFSISKDINVLIKCIWKKATNNEHLCLMDFE